MATGAMVHLYTALLRGFLRYSLSVLTSVNKTSLYTIQSVQAQALRICLGLPRSASTVATIAIAGEHLAQIHVEVEALRTHIKHLARTPHHHLASLPENRPRTSFCISLTAHGESIPTRFLPTARTSIPPGCLMLAGISLNIPYIQKKSELSPQAL